MLPKEEFIDQHPDALRLTLVEGTLDHSKFQLLASDGCCAGELTVRATVIGASHIVTLNAGSFVFNEVFACMGLEDVASWTLRELLATPVERTFPGMCYEFTVRTIAWQDPEPPELIALVKQAQRFAGRDGNIGVVQEFPAGDCLVVPKTVIVGMPDATGRGFTIQTAHSYPNVRGLVLSHSTLYHT